MVRVLEDPIFGDAAPRMALAISGSRALPRFRTGDSWLTSDELLQAANLCFWNLTPVLAHEPQNSKPSIYGRRYVAGGVRRRNIRKRNKKNFMPLDSAMAMVSAGM